MRRTNNAPVWLAAGIASTSVSTLSGLAILFFTLGSAAWNGVNAFVAAYLVLSGAGVLGLLTGFCAVFSSRRLFVWATFLGALSIALLSVIYAGWFLFARDPAVPLKDPLEIGGYSMPILAFYGLIFCFCVAQAVLFYPRGRSTRTNYDTGTQGRSSHGSAS